MNDEGLCPACREHCEWVDNEDDDDNFRLGESVSAWEARTGYAGTLHSEALKQLHDQVQNLLGE